MPEPAADSGFRARSEEEAIMVDMVYDDADFSFAVNDDSITMNAQGGSGVVTVAANEQPSLAEMIIHTVSANIETLTFDETIENVHRLIATYGAFIESSNVTGINNEANFYGWNFFRNANFTLRVPVENLNAMTANLSALGNVVHQSSHAENITMQFHDTQSRLNSLRIQEERLLEMMSRADEVVDLIAIEERLGDIRMQVESFQTMLNLWQNQVSYSTLHLNIWEVESFTEVVEAQHLTYWEQIGTGFMRTLRNIGSFFMNLFMWLAVNIPVLIILAVITFAVVILIRRYDKKTRKKREDKKKEGSIKQEETE